MVNLVDNPLELSPEAVLAAEAMVQEYCGWHIAPSRTETLTINGVDGPKLLLPTLKVTAITSISENGVVLSPAAYVWSESGMVEKLWGWWTWKPRAIQVTLTHGYDQCPLGVREVVRHLAESGPGAAPVATAQVGQVRVTYSQPTPSLAALEAYKLPAA